MKQSVLRIKTKSHAYVLHTQMNTRVFVDGGVLLCLHVYVVCLAGFMY